MVRVQLYWIVSSPVPQGIRPLAVYQNVIQLVFWPWWTHVHWRCFGCGNFICAGRSCVLHIQSPVFHHCHLFHCRSSGDQYLQDAWGGNHFRVREVAITSGWQSLLILPSTSTPGHILPAILLLPLCFNDNYLKVSLLSKAIAETPKCTPILTSPPLQTHPSTQHTPHHTKQFHCNYD